MRTINKCKKCCIISLCIAVLAGIVFDCTDNSVDNDIDEYEPDNTPSQAITLDANGIPQNHYISSSDQDWFTIQAQPEMRYRIRLEGDVTIGLWKNGNCLAYQRDSLIFTGDGQVELRVTTGASDSPIHYGISCNESDTYEPDDRREQATLLNTDGIQQNHIVSNSDEDWFTVQAQPEMRYRIRLEGDVTIGLWKNGNCLAYQRDSLIFTGDGQVELRVTTGASDSPIHYGISCNESDTYEPDDRREQATLLGIKGVAQNHYISNVEEDWFAVQTIPTKKYLVRLTGGVFIGLWKDNNCLAYQKDSLIFTGDGRVELRVTTGTSTDPIPYIINCIGYDANDSYEPDNSRGQATLLETNGVAQNHYISNADEDWFAVQTIPAKKYLVRLTGNVTIGLWKDNNCLAYQKDSLIFTGDGRAELRVTTGVSNDPIPYTIKCIGDDANDAYEPDDSHEQATLLETNGVAQNHVTSMYDLDWYKFKREFGMFYLIKASTSVNISVSGINYLTDKLIMGGGNDTLFFKTTFEGLKVPYTIFCKSSNAFIAFVAPAKNTPIEVGSTIVIKCLTSDNSGPSGTMLLYNGDTVVTIISNVADLQNGSYYYNYNAEVQSVKWDIPRNFPLSSTYWIKLISNNDNSIYGCSDTFAITGFTGSIQIVSPTTELLSSSNFKIQWNYTGNLKAINIDLYNNSAFVQRIYSNANYMNREFTWKIADTLPTSSSYQIKVVMVEDTTIQDISGPFTIKRIPGELTITVPTSTTNWTSGNKYSIYWAKTGIVGQYMSISLADSMMSETLIASKVNIGSLRFDWTIPDTISPGTYRVKTVSLMDSSIADYSDYFTVTKP